VPFVSSATHRFTRVIRVRPPVDKATNPQLWPSTDPQAGLPRVLIRVAGTAPACKLSRAAFDLRVREKQLTPMELR
jgi:hypothetical protein